MCTSFDTGDLKKLFDADGIADAVDFSFIASIRRQSDGQLHCPDEAAGCPSTRYGLCAKKVSMASANSTQTQIIWHTCWSETAPHGKDGPLAPKAQTCAGQSSLDYDSISTCFAGDEGEALVNDAAAYFVKRFPDHAPGGSSYPKYGVPRVDIDGEEQGIDEYPSSYDELLATLCSKGITAAACDSVFARDYSV